MKQLYALLAVLVIGATRAQAQIGTDLLLTQAVEAALQSQPLTRAALNNPEPITNVRTALFANLPAFALRTGAARPQFRIHLSWKLTF